MRQNNTAYMHKREYNSILVYYVEIESEWYVSDSENKYKTMIDLPLKSEKIQRINLQIRIRLKIAEAFSDKISELKLKGYDVSKSSVTELLYLAFLKKESQE